MSTTPFFCHPLGLAESTDIGEGTRIWAWAHVMEGASVGARCNVGEHCFVERGALVGDDVVIKNGVAVWDGVTLGNRVFVGPNAVFTNDPAPRSKLFKPVARTVVGEGASIGANATILCGIELGRYAMVGAGAVVTRNVAAFTLVLGTPAREVAQVCVCGKKTAFDPDRRSRCSCGAVLRRGPDGIVLEADYSSADPKKGPAIS